jgi:glycosyltransferase involved in cell wall biosynthesis
MPPAAAGRGHDDVFGSGNKSAELPFNPRTGVQIEGVMGEAADMPEAGSTRGIDICVFAHNEAGAIATFLSDLSEQTLLQDRAIDVRVWVMANGCTDDTVDRAERWLAAEDGTLARRTRVVALEKGGKSRTWNAFTHGVARPESELFIFMDADIRLVEPTTLGRMVAAIVSRPELKVFVSRPVKDICHFGKKTGAVGWLIAKGSGMLDEFRTSIAGSLYVLRSDMARAIAMPIGLPVEDGFLREMVLTDLLSQPEQISRIDGDPTIFHVYESIQTVGALLRHQTRLIIGSAINAALFAAIRRRSPTLEDSKAILREAMADETWLPRLVAAELPRAPFGYVPFHFLHKRLAVLRRKDIDLNVTRLAMLAIGVVFDAVVYVAATAKMARREGVGYW